MQPDASVVADPAAGVASLGPLRVEMASAGTAGELRFGGEGGTVLRPLRFGERTELVAAASAQAASRDAVAAAVLAAALVERGSGGRALLETLALWMAGAAWDAPPFLDTTLLVGRAAGWSLQDLLGAPATEVDRLAAYLDEQERGGWNAIVFLPPPAQELSEIRARFADQLLRRGGGATPAMELPPSVRRNETGEAGALQSAAPGGPSPAGAVRGAARDEAHEGPRGARTGKAASELPIRRSGADTMRPSDRRSPDGTPYGTPPAAGEPERSGETTQAGLANPPGDARTTAAVAAREGSGSESSSRRVVLSSRGPRRVGDSTTQRLGQAQPAGAAAGTAAAPRSTSTVTTGKTAASATRFRILRAEARMTPALAATAPIAATASLAAMAPIAATAEVPADDVLQRELVLLSRQPSFSADLRAGPVRRAEHPIDVADALAALLDDEADLRGVER